MLKRSKTIGDTKNFRVTPFSLPECGWVVAASGCHIVSILRTIEGGANAPFEEKLDPYESDLVLYYYMCVPEVHVELLLTYWLLAVATSYSSTIQGVRTH